MNTVIGIFEAHRDADAAVDDLNKRGFNPKDISVIVKESKTTDHQVGSKGGSVAEGAATGIATGGMLGGLAGLLVGVGALALPGAGAFLFAGPIAVALGLTGAAAATVTGLATGAVAGGVVGSLVGLGIPEDVARTYETRLTEGAVLLAIPTGNMADEGEVKRVLEDYNADQVRTIDDTRISKRF